MLCMCVCVRRVGGEKLSRMENSAKKKKRELEGKGETDLEITLLQVRRMLICNAAGKSFPLRAA